MKIKEIIDAAEKAGNYLDHSDGHRYCLLGMADVTNDARFEGGCCYYADAVRADEAPDDLGLVSRYGIYWAIDQDLARRCEEEGLEYADQAAWETPSEVELVGGYDPSNGHNC